MVKPPSAVYSEDDSGGDGSGEPTEPLVFQNPDGSLHHALPTGTHYKQAQPETPPNERLSRDWVVWDPALLVQIERIYRRHEKVYMIFVFLQFLLENSFNALLIKHRESTLKELVRAYPFITAQYAPVVFWVIVGVSATFAAAYYVLAGLTVWERRSAYMKPFSEMAMIGILGQVMLAYINRFNLILFFLRFVVFAHSRFLLSILNGTARIIVPRRTETNATDRQEDTIIIEV